MAGENAVVKTRGYQNSFSEECGIPPALRLEAGPVAACKTGADWRIANDPGWKLASPEGVRGDHVGESI